MRRKSPSLGDVIQLSLPDGRYAYGRVLNDGFVAFYAGTSDTPATPPIGSRDYQFVVGVYADVLRRDDVPVVGTDLGIEGDQWPPEFKIVDILSGEHQIYSRGAIRNSTKAEAEDLEPVAAWGLDHILNRLEKNEKNSDNQ